MNGRLVGTIENAQICILPGWLSQWLIDECISNMQIRLAKYLTATILIQRWNILYNLLVVDRWLAIWACTTPLLYDQIMIALCSGHRGEFLRRVCYEWKKIWKKPTLLSAVIIKWINAMRTKLLTVCESAVTSSIDVISPRWASIGQRHTCILERH